MNDTGYSTARALLGDGDAIAVDLTKLNKSVLIDTIDELVELYFVLEEMNKSQKKAFEDTTDYSIKVVDQSLNLRKALEHRKLAELAELQANRPDAL